MQDDGVDPQTCLADVITRIVNRQPMIRIDELFPFAYFSADAERAVA